MLKRISIFWVILLALAITSAVPVAAIAILEVNASGDQLERDAQSRFEERVQGRAQVFQAQLVQFRQSTDLVASQSYDLLTRKAGSVLSEDEVAQRLEKYTYSGPYDLFGLDEWYRATYWPATHDDRISNAFIEEGREFTPDMQYTVAVTESLNPLFAALGDAIDTSNFIGRHNLTLITANGVMRRYPYISNAFTPVFPFTETSDWVDASPEENPERVPVWSVPLIAIDRDGGFIVYNAIPIDVEGEYVAVASHDLNLEVLTQAVTSLEVSKSGFAFMMDSAGYIIIHPDFEPTLLWQQTEYQPALRAAMLADEEALNAWYVANIDIQIQTLYPNLDMERVLATPSGSLDFEHEGETWALTYQQISETGWYLVMMQPRAELVAAAATVSDRVQRAALAMTALVLGVSVVLARRITRPVLQLSETAQKIEASVDEETNNLISDNLERLANVGNLREIDNLAKVFEQMVVALQQRMTELGSVYAMGQTITSNVDYEATMQAILTSIQQVVDFDAAEIAIARKDTLVVEAWQGHEGYQNTQGQQYPIGQGLIGEMAAQRTVLFQPRVEASASFAMETEQHEVRSILGIPLVVGPTLIGAIILAHHSPDYFGESAKRQLLKLAPQASIAIDNAVKVKEREAALKQQIEELKIEIDQTKRKAQVQEVTDSDFFRNLQANAEKMRRRVERDQDADEAEPPKES